VKLRLPLLFLLALVALGAVPDGTRGQISIGPEVGLGFGPSSVQPVSLGVPIYTQGDNVWLESYYNATVDISFFTPQGVDRTGAVAVEPGQLLLLYSFRGADPSGPWILSVTTSSGLSDIFVSVKSPDNSLVPAFDGSRLKGSELNQTFTLPSTDAYNIQLCSVGESLVPAFSFPLAGGLSGTVVASLLGNSSQFTVTGIESPLSTWLELYSQYSYETGAEGTTSQNLLVATSPVVTASPPGASELVSLVQKMPMRQGRFDLWVFDRTTSGLALHETQFLRTVNGTWVQLGGCTIRENAYSSVLSLATGLDSANSTWPRQLVTMYTMAGIESYTETAISGGEAAILFRDFPEGGELTGVSFTASAPGLETSNWEAGNSSVYLLTNGQPTEVSIRLSFSGIAFDEVNVSIPGAYSSKLLYVNAGTLVVSATQQGEVLPNATLTVGAQGSQAVVVKGCSTGSASILLPPGDYTAYASYGGVSSSEPVTVTPGRISAIRLDLTQQSVPVFLYLLAGLGATGVIANLLLWRGYLERRKVYG